MKRTEIRELLFKLLYEIEIQKDTSDEHILLFLNDNDIKDPEVTEYIQNSIKIIEENKNTIEEYISKNLKKDWSLERISKVNLALLKLAIFEIKYTDTPFKVVINEVVNLAKKYSDDAGPAFINGLLAKVVEE